MKAEDIVAIVILGTTLLFLAIRFILPTVALGLGVFALGRYLL